MKQFIFLGIFFIFTATLGYSQTFELGVESGIATFSMSDLKKTNEKMQGDLPFKTEITYNFPAYIYYKPMALVNFKHISVGFSTSFQSTGSRISRQDYSGEYAFDMILSSWTPGLEGSVLLFTKSNNSIRLALSGGAVFSKLEEKDHLTLYDSVLSKNNISLKGTNLFVLPSIRYAYQINSIKIGVNAGYLVQLWDNPLYLASDSEKKSYLKSDWSGLRAGLFVSYLINNE